MFMKGILAIPDGKSWEQKGNDEIKQRWIVQNKFKTPPSHAIWISLSLATASPPCWPQQRRWLQLPVIVKVTGSGSNFLSWVWWRELGLISPFTLLSAPSENSSRVGIYLWSMNERWHWGLFGWVSQLYSRLPADPGGWWWRKWELSQTSVYTNVHLSPLPDGSDQPEWDAVNPMVFRSCFVWPVLGIPTIWAPFLEDSVSYSAKHCRRGGRKMSQNETIGTKPIIWPMILWKILAHHKITENPVGQREITPGIASTSAISLSSEP